MPDFIKCEFCRVEIPTETCKLAAHSATIDGKQYLFCCEQCAKRYREKRKGKTKPTRK